MLKKSEYDKLQPYVTKDGSIIRELMHPSTHFNANQSLAEANIPPGATTHLHKHNNSEEIYHVLSGSGILTLGNERFGIKEGDTICIPPGTPHQIKNTAPALMKILCACAPPYSHNDTELVIPEKNDRMNFSGNEL
jgi:mannose-6-phosphate isomerase-like protein (cupin superfamily)